MKGFHLRKPNLAQIKSRSKDPYFIPMFYYSLCPGEFDFCKLLKSLNPVSQDNFKYWNNHGAVLNFKPVTVPPRSTKTCAVLFYKVSHRAINN